MKMLKNREAVKVTGLAVVFEANGVGVTSSCYHHVRLPHYLRVSICSPKASSLRVLHRRALEYSLFGERAKIFEEKRSRGF
jgi:hypothetical protein